MSQTQKPTVEEKYGKNVQIVCYLSEQRFESDREAAQFLDDTLDYQEVEDETDKEYYLITGDGKIEIDEERHETLQGMNIGDLSLRHIETTETVYSHHPSTASTNWLKSFVTGADDSIDFLEPRLLTGTYSGPDGETLLRHKRRGPKTMGLLKHQSEAHPDDMWENEDAELWCIKLIVRMKNCTEEQLQRLTDDHLETLIRELQASDKVSRVRWNECVETQKKEGVCYDV